MGKKGIEDMIDEIEIFVENCKYQPLSQSKIVVVKDELLNMLNELKLRLPTEIERSNKIMRNKDLILSEARTRSDAIITESVNEANRMIDQHEITRLANIRSEEILEMARNQAQQIVDQASDEANEIRLGAMYYTKDKLTEMRDIFTKVHDMEKENYRTLIESLENDTYVVETNMSEMEANINMFTAQTNMSFTNEENAPAGDSAFDDMGSDTAFAASQPQPSSISEKSEVLDDVFGDDDVEDIPAAQSAAYADEDEDDDDFDDFLDE